MTHFFTSLQWLYNNFFRKISWQGPKFCRNIRFGKIIQLDWGPWPQKFENQVSEKCVRSLGQVSQFEWIFFRRCSIKTSWGKCLFANLNLFHLLFHKSKIFLVWSSWIDSVFLEYFFNVFILTIPVIVFLLVDLWNKNEWPCSIIHNVWAFYYNFVVGKKVFYYCRYLFM